MVADMVAATVAATVDSANNNIMKKAPDHGAFFVID